MRDDISAMHRVRLSVRENRLASSISQADYVSEIEETGRGWVIELDGTVVAFAVGNAVTGNLSALFVDPRHEGRGQGRRLHDAAVAWLFARGPGRLWLTTGPGTRAQRFYEAAGWSAGRMLDNGELRFERCNPDKT